MSEIIFESPPATLQADAEGNSRSMGIAQKARWIFTTAMVALSFSHGGIKATEPKTENGLYQVLDSGGIIVEFLDGKKIHLGKKLED